ncbi:MAG: PEP-CTERM sorting domain-containing protein [Pirellulales bacterium]|nr:PEP-CTERM sorting domain-containing protein [Pirellulales bacterium]
MSRSTVLFLTRQVTHVAVGIVGTLLANVTFAVGLVYVDADPILPNIAPGAAFVSSTSSTDNLWAARTGYGAAQTIFESIDMTEDAPELVQTISGLTPGNTYDVYGVYWSDEDENWSLNAGMSSGVTTLYSWTGTGGRYPAAGSAHGLPASLAVWDSPPSPTVEGTIYTQRPADPLVMLLGKAGTGVADGSGNLDVYLNDINNNVISGLTARRRTWLDGVAFVDVTGGAVSVAASATLDRQTGALTFNNPTAQNIDIKGIRIASWDTGALNAVTWTSIHSSNALWTITEPVDPPSTPYANILDENGGGTSITLTSGGGSLSLGNVWNPSPFDHVVIYLTLGDDSLAVLTPQLTGDPIDNGDFDADGTIDLDDYLTLLTNIHTDISSNSRVEGYRKGEMTSDGLINYSDFVAFRAAYDLAHGTGSFSLMSQSVPEPCSLLGMLLGGALAWGFRHRRGYVAGLALLLVFCATQTSSAVPVLAVDIDDRTAFDSPNGVAGFESFTLSTTTGTTTRALAGGFSVSVAPFDDHVDENSVTAGVQDGTGTLDDRDRSAPVDSGSLTIAQLYDDFIYATSTVGPTGGLDLTISGGTLQSNKPYLVSIYSYDNTTSGYRTTKWLDVTRPIVPILTTGWDGDVLPTTNDQYKFSGVALTNGSGVLSLQGRSTAGHSTSGSTKNAVFLNAFEINDFAGITLEVDTTTGAVRLLNEQSNNLNLSYYEIRSSSGALDLGSWASLDDAEMGDPVGTGWDEAAGSSANILSEANLLSELTLSSSGGDASLGSAYNTAGLQDLLFYYAEAADTALRPGYVKYVSSPAGVPGDYNNNGVVDSADYVLWRKGGPLLNEVHNPGTVSVEDYTEWRARFGNTSGSGSVLGNGSAVPEPTTFGTAALLLLVVVASRRQAPYFKAMR